jgi:type I restriction enzyme S subunit
MEKQQNKIPLVRFPEFKEAWEVKKLGAVAVINPKSNELPNNFIYIDLESVKKGVLLKEIKIEKVEAPSRAQRLLSRDDILFQMVRPYQKNNLFFDIDENQYVASTGYAQIKAKGNPKYLFHFIHTSKFVDNVLLRCTGTSYPAINSSDLSKINVSFPSLPEQQKIAHFFTTLDKKINQLEEKKNGLEKYKKGMMQQIFSQELRFKDENGNDFPDWEEKKLGEVTNYTKGFAFKSSNYSDIGSRIIRVSDLGDSKIKSKCNKIFINESRSKDFVKYKLIKGDIIITTVGSNPELRGSSVGRGILVMEDNLGYLNQNLLKFNVNSEFNNEFIYGFINTDKYFHYIKSVKRGNANQANITVVDLLDYKIALPNLDEQTKIANFLSKIDAKINAVNTQIEQTNTYKKGLLQSMFVN